MNRGVIGLGTYADEGGELHVIIETPKGSRNKMNFAAASCGVSE